MPIRLDKLTYTMPRAQAGATALNNISLEIADGEFIGLMGHSGSGKTALLELVSGIVRPDEGAVFVDGVDIHRNRGKRGIQPWRPGFFTQNSHKQFFQRSMERELKLSLKRLAISDEERELRSKKAFEAMGFDWERDRTRHPLSLSVGERRRLALACILVYEPSVLILDEPFANLDSEERNIVARELVRLNKSGVCIIMACNDADFLSEHAGRILIMDKGRIIRDERARELFTEYYYLLRHGLSVPKVRKAAQLLAEQGVNMPLNIISYEQFIDRLKIIMWRKDQ